uniref:Uncharacterized protein n=1 Tax=Tetranychus urticae TaxID=32264 RepID=T1K2U5_TETUR
MTLGKTTLSKTLARARQLKETLLKSESQVEARAELIGNIYDALIDCGYDEIKAGFAAEKYRSLEEALEALAAGAFEKKLDRIRQKKRKQFIRQIYKKGVLIPINFF